MKWIVSTFAALLLAAPAQAKLYYHHSPHASRAVIHATQLKNLAHSRYVCAHGAHANQRWHCKAVVWLEREAAETAPPPVTSPTAVICAVFGPHCSEALAVARCESHFSVWAHNGQYLGLFQMGSHERAIYGHGNDAWSQARAAKRYFDAAGWSPWQCRP